MTIGAERGWNFKFSSVRELLGDRAKRSTVYWVLDKPSEPLPREWGLAAARTRRGWHFQRAAV